jgi:hypothetical protein
MDGVEFRDALGNCVGIFAGEVIPPNAALLNGPNLALLCKQVPGNGKNVRIDTLVCWACIGDLLLKGSGAGDDVATEDVANACDGYVVPWAPGRQEMVPPLCLYVFSSKVLLLRGRCGSRCKGEAKYRQFAHGCILAAIS